MTGMACAVPSCKFSSAPSGTLTEQAKEMQAHLPSHFPTRHRKKEIDMPAGQSIIEKLWDEIDGFITQAMEWPTAADVIWNTEADRLGDELAKAKVTAAGRGIAIALQLMTQPHYASADDVVRAAVERYQARRNEAAAQNPVVTAAPDPVTVVTSLPVAVAEPAVQADPWANAPAPVAVVAPPMPPPLATEPVAVAAPVATAVAEADPIATLHPALVDLDEAVIASIRNALAQQFPAEQLVDLFKLPLDAVESLRG